RAGWLRYLTASDASGALRELEPASRTGTPAQRALALAGLGEIAEDRIDSLTATRSFVAALQAAPTDPVAELAAVRLLDLEGDSPQVDNLISEAARALKAPVAPRAARLVREAAARIAARRAALAAGPAIEVAAWRAVGTVQRWRVGGPFAALRLFDLRQTLALDGRVAATVAMNDRALEFPDGDAGLDFEPADGDVSDLTSTAPAALSGARAAATCELGQACVAASAWKDRADLRAAAAAMLEEDPFDALAAWLLARAEMGDDRAASRAAVDRAV